MRVTSREYKVIVDASLFNNLSAGLSDILDDIRDLAQLDGLELAEEFRVKDPKERTILFLDTPDFTLRQNGLLLRQRVKLKSSTTEYTLKYRTEDRYIASGSDLGASPELKSGSNSKFEEDIACPFVSRFSHSTTVTLDDQHELAGENFPRTLSRAIRLFPGLLAVRRDSLLCVPETPFMPVNGRKVLERVFTGPTVRFPNGQDRSASTSATVALILWSKGKGKGGRTLTAECSFRYENADEAFPLEVASAAKRFFQGLQHMDWARPEASTKTQFMYENV